MERLAVQAERDVNALKKIKNTYKNKVGEKFRWYRKLCDKIQMFVECLIP